MMTAIILDHTICIVLLSFGKEPNFIPSFYSFLKVAGSAMFSVARSFTKNLNYN